MCFFQIYKLQVKAQAEVCLKMGCIWNKTGLTCSSRCQIRSEPSEGCPQLLPVPSTWVAASLHQEHTGLIIILTQCHRQSTAKSVEIHIQDNMMPKKIWFFPEFIGYSTFCALNLVCKSSFLSVVLYFIVMLRSVCLKRCISELGMRSRLTYLRSISSSQKANMDTSRKNSIVLALLSFTANVFTVTAYLIQICS